MEPFRRKLCSSPDDFRRGLLPSPATCRLKLYYICKTFTRLCQHWDASRWCAASDIDAWGHFSRSGASHRVSRRCIVSLSLRFSRVQTCGAVLRLPWINKQNNNAFLWIINLTFQFDTLFEHAYVIIKRRFWRTSGTDGKHRKYCLWSPLYSPCASAYFISIILMIFVSHFSKPFSIMKYCHKREVACLLAFLAALGGCDNNPLLFTALLLTFHISNIASRILLWFALVHKASWRLMLHRTVCIGLLHFAPMDISWNAHWLDGLTWVWAAMNRQWKFSWA